MATAVATLPGAGAPVVTATAVTGAGVGVSSEPDLARILTEYRNALEEQAKVQSKLDIVARAPQRGNGDSEA